jgi:hypothetical protein
VPAHARQPGRPERDGDGTRFAAGDGADTTGLGDVLRSRIERRGRTLLQRLRAQPAHVGGFRGDVVIARHQAEQPELAEIVRAQAIVP